LFFKMEFVHGFYDQEQDKGNQKEVDDSGDKGSIGKYCGIFAASDCEG